MKKKKIIPISEQAIKISGLLHKLVEDIRAQGQPVTPDMMTVVSVSKSAAVVLSVLGPTL